MPAHDEVWDVEEQAVLDDFQGELNISDQKSAHSVKWILLFILLWFTSYSVSLARAG